MMSDISDSDEDFQRILDSAKKLSRREHERTVRSQNSKLRNTEGEDEEPDVEEGPLNLEGNGIHTEKDNNVLRQDQFDQLQEACRVLSRFTANLEEKEMKEANDMKETNNQQDSMDESDGLSRVNEILGMDAEEVSAEMEELKEFFEIEEEHGEPIMEELASILNKSLRKKPNDKNIKEKIAKIKKPSNLKNLTVPKTNTDVAKLLNTASKIADASLIRINSIISAAIIPISRILSDIAKKKISVPKEESKSLHQTVSLLVAAVNYVNQARKDVIRNCIKQPAIIDLCKWDQEVGETELFPFNVSNKCEEMRKSKFKIKGYQNNQNSKYKRFTPYLKRDFTTRPFLQWNRQQKPKPYWKKQNQERNTKYQKNYPRRR